MAINLDDIDLDISTNEALNKLQEPDEKPDEKPDATAVVPEPVPVETASKQADLTAELTKLQEERNALLKRLNTLTVTSAAQQKRLDSLAKSIEEKEKQVDAGPSYEQIDQSFATRIQELENAIEEAEVKDPTKVAKLARELRAVERQYNSFQIEARAEMLRPPAAEELVGRSVAETKAALAFEQTRLKILEDFPELNADGEAPNDVAIQEVYDTYHPLIKGGMEPAKALAKAVKVVTNEYNLVPVSKRTPPTPPKVEEPPKPTDRKTEAVKRNVEAAKNTPPDLTNAGSSDTGGSLVDKFDFGKMSIDEFMRIPDSDLAKIEEALLRYGE
jgi:hypothetical protein